jgi:energy-coupling factor transporter ATP-binding protein EcfA2
MADCSVKTQRGAGYTPRRIPCVKSFVGQWQEHRDDVQLDVAKLKCQWYNEVMEAGDDVALELSLIRSLHIQNLRGVQEGRLEDLSPLVVLVGPNSSGKSTVLDAIYIAAGGRPEKSLGEVVARRPSLEQPDRWILFRTRGGEVGPATIEITTDEPEMLRVQVFRSNGNGAFQALDIRESWVAPKDEIKPPPSPPDPNTPPVRNTGLERAAQRAPVATEVRLVDPHGGGPRQPLHELYSRIAERGLRREAKAILTDLVPGLEDIEILTQDSQPVVYLVFDTGALPVGLAGDGVRLLLQQAFELASPAGGVVLLEEPEIHMHPAAIGQSAKAMLAAMRRGIQVILTTHSLDLIDALLGGAAPDELDKLSFYRLRLDRGLLRSSRLSGSEASLSRTQIEDDLR